MTLPATIHAAVSPAAITKVTRLFNGSVADVLNELLQNARRAGASRVDIATFELAGQPTLSIADDGHGIDDPSNLVTLGQSGWGDDTIRREDPAGMGIFSLAGRRVEIRSYSRAAHAGWRVVIPEDAWETSAALTIEPFDIDAGTEILIELPEAWASALETSAAASARYYPLPVTLNARELDRAGFLEGAVYVDEVAGVRIGVFQATGTYTRDSQINFHGLQVEYSLPSVSELRTVWHWRVRVDIIDAPNLQLVLPARKEMVQNAALTALAEHAERAIYCAIQAQPCHHLRFRNWKRAKELGIDLPEAEPGLEAWIPVTANGQRETGERLSTGPLILIPPYEAYIEQSVARALAETSAKLPGQLARMNSSYEGYGWYDALPVVADLRFLIRRGAVTYEASGDETLPDDLDSGPVDAISLNLAIDPTDASIEHREHITIPATAMIETRGSYGGVDDAILLWRHDVQPGIDEVMTFIELACFCYDEDHSTDSYDTQLDLFRDDAYRLATNLLLTEEQAALHCIERALLHTIRWMIPQGRTLTVTATSTSAEVAFAPAAFDSGQ